MTVLVGLLTAVFAVVVVDSQWLRRTENRKQWRSTDVVVGGGGISGRIGSLLNLVARHRNHDEDQRRWVSRSKDRSDKLVT